MTNKAAFFGTEQAATAPQSLLAATAEYHLLAQMPSPLAVFGGDDFIIEFANPALLQIWNKSAEEVLNKPYFEVFAHLQNTGLENLYHEVYRTGLAQVREEVSYLVENNGAQQERFFKIIYTPIRNAAGAITGIMAPGYDITEQVKARRIAEEKEEFNRTILESSPDCIKIIDTEGRMISMSHQGLCLMELDDFCQVASQYWWDLWPEESRDTIKASVAKALKGQSTQFQAFCPTAKGTPKWWDVVVSPVHNTQGGITEIISVSRDITYQHRYQQSIDASEKRFRSTFENAQAGIAHVAPDGKLLLVNERFCVIVGHSREKLLEHGFQDITHPEDLKLDLELVQQVLDGDKESYNLEKRYIREDGETIWVNLTVSLVRDEAGAPQYFISVIQDLSQRKAAEEKVRQSEAQYRNLAENLEQQVAQRTGELEQSQAFLKSVLNRTQNGIITYQPIRNKAGIITDFRITFINDMVTKDLGQSAAGIIGKTMLETFPDAAHNGAFTQLVRFVDYNEDGHFPITVFHPNGPLYFDVVADRLGEGATVTITNITGQRKAALQLEALNQELKRSNADLQQFAHVASHDLKEPVRKIKTFTSRLQSELEGKLEDRSIQYLDKIQSAASRMISMIDGVLKYSTLSGNEEPVEEVNLNEILGNIESDLEVLLQQKTAVLEIEPLPTLQGARVLLYQLFYNLVNNSLKFSRPEVPPHIRIHSEAVMVNAKSFFKIKVTDNGIGFDPAYAERIFTTFTRLHSKDQYEGTGLGLALCQKIAERHGGSIQASSNKGEGAVFTILLPA
ncbi:PAS domain S-box-containing protein [Cnuella takakiae]|uniref:histidine kinase n=1 Tax=Cnuella takakiae TaxID=1302690 RepID=A0A1M4W099_9BACT|nr:PAS domain S-box protein [Cnuella takakiae]OLY92451.1 hypothetical protein BUE76_11555 [Cnuella takakiae]SHE74543.1 PAS domain S-box-containing protein [Cnuella takakiae]